MTMNQKWLELAQKLDFPFSLSFNSAGAMLCMYQAPQTVRKYVQSLDEVGKIMALWETTKEADAKAKVAATAFFDAMDGRS